MWVLGSFVCVASDGDKALTTDSVEGVGLAGWFCNSGCRFVSRIRSGKPLLFRACRNASCATLGQVALRLFGRYVGRMASERNWQIEQRCDVGLALVWAREGLLIRDSSLGLVVAID